MWILPLMIESRKIQGWRAQKKKKKKCVTKKKSLTKKKFVKYRQDFKWKMK